MPALVINTNVASLNGQRNLYRSNESLNKSLERLSSGLRINRAGDDAAGLAISENLRTRIRGLDQAVRNANDGISLIQTAEGAIDTYTEILQRIRQLAIQASSDVNSSDNRAALQLEIDEQLSELKRIADTMDFNGQMLFDGTFINKRIQVGPVSGQYLDISIGDLRPSVIGGVAKYEGLPIQAATAGPAPAALSDGDVLINGVAIPSSASNSAQDKVLAVNEVTNQTGVYARSEPPQTVGTAPIAAGTLDLTNSLVVNGVTIPASGSVTVTAGDSSGELRRAINSVSQDTGVYADVDSTGALVLTSSDDTPIQYTFNGTANTVLNLTGAAGAEETVLGRVRLYSDQAFTVADGTGSAASLLGIAAGSYPKDPNTPIDFVDVTSFELAQESILRVDQALRQINDIRAQLGALTNRLENTVSNMMISSENLSASESRIRDADFAVETANLTRAQILQQSGVAVLAQANQTPQAALQLLQ